MANISFKKGVSDTAELASLKRGLESIPPKAVTAIQVYKAILKGGNPTIFQLISGYVFTISEASWGSFTTVSYTHLTLPTKRIV